MSRKGSNLEYRRVRGEDVEDDLSRTIERNSQHNPCIFPCLLFLLIILSLSLALLFFITSPHRHSLLTGQSSTDVNDSDSSSGIGLRGKDFNGTTFMTTMTTTSSGWTGDNSTNGSETTTTIRMNVTSIGNETEDEQVRNLREQLVTLIRKTEATMENITGLEGELLIPGFMVLVFLTAVSLVSCCCCLLARRRERRRRQLFGKIITDLQTGDSKRVLLNHSDLDD